MTWIGQKVFDERCLANATDKTHLHYSMIHFSGKIGNSQFLSHSIWFRISNSHSTLSNFHMERRCCWSFFSILIFFQFILRWSLNTSAIFERCLNYESNTRRLIDHFEVLQYQSIDFLYVTFRIEWQLVSIQLIWLEAKNQSKTLIVHYAKRHLYA